MNTNIGDYLKKLEATHGGAMPKKVPHRKKPLHIARKTLKWAGSHRVLAGGVAVVMLLIMVTPTLMSVVQQRRYALSSETNKVLSDANASLAKKLVYDEQTQSYVFNKEHMPFDIPGSNSDEDTANRVAAIRLLQSKAKLEQSLKVGGSSSSDEQLYSSSISKDFAQGATYYDNKAQLSFSLVPQFKAMAGDMVGSRLVYPLKDLGGQAIYSVEASGVKEDVVLQKYSTDTITLSYKLQMAQTLEAKLLPNGTIGIYSADASLFADNSTSNDSDVDKMLQAQKTADKTQLVFVIPAPIVTDKNGRSEQARSKFELKGNTVDVITTNLSKAAFPLSIDPTVVVANSSTFSSGQNESNADITADRVQRTATSGGEIESLNSTSAMTVANGRTYFGLAATNNYMYTVGGFNITNGALSNVQYAPINSNGTLGSWVTTTPLPDERGWLDSVVYNGYLYAIGGRYASSTYFNTVFYAPLNGDGSVGAWATTSALPTNKSFSTSAVYNGYVYNWGGLITDNASAVSTVVYAPINANGTLGSWVSTSGFTGARSSHGGVIYNGFIYVYGGLNASSALVNTSQYAPINSDGSVGTWQTTTPTYVPQRSFGTTVYGGYIYIFGSVQSGGPSATIYYAPLSASGAIGTWTDTSVTQTIASARGGNGSIAINGYMYTLGGGTTGASLSDVQYGKLTDAGQTTVSRLTSTSFTTTRERHAVTSYNGYVYITGGTGGATSTYYGYCQYAPIAAGGDITSSGWAGNNCGVNVSPTRSDHATVAYNGFLYNIGGFNGAVGTAGVGTYYNTVQRANINASTGALSGSTTDTALPSARSGISAVAYNGYMYVAGGRDAAGNNLTTVNYATINASTGAIGTWGTTAALPSAVNRMRVVTSGGYMYVMGGTTAAMPTVNNGGGTGTRATGAASNIVRYAVINSNGTLGTWNSTASMISPRSEFSAVAYQGYLYAIGGFHNTTAYSSTEVAKINSDGTVGAWQASSELLLTGGVGLGSSAATAYNGIIYILGGRSDTATTTDSPRSTATRIMRINNAGTGLLDPITTSSNSLTVSKSYGASTYLNGYAYTIGGNNTNNYNYAALNKDGSTSTWTSGTFPINLTGASAIAYEGYLYVIGGNTTNTYFAKPNSDGSISNWTASTALPVALQNAGSATSNGYVYIIGGGIGSTAQSTIYYAQLNQDGSIGVWQTAGNAMPAARYSGTAVILNNTIYYAGGYNSVSQKGVYYSPINPDGSPSQWTTSPESLPYARHGSVGVGVNGSIYIMGGNASASIMSTTINSNGTVSPWQTQPVALPAALTNASGIYANGYLYSFGGNPSTAVYYASVDTITRTAVYSKMIAMGANTNIRSVTTSGLNADGVSVTMRSAGTNGVFGAPTAGSTGTYDGSTTDWAATTSLPSGSNGGAALTYNGYMYVLRAGASSTLYAKVNGDGTTGTWAYTTATPGPRQYAGLVTANGYLYVVGGQDGGSLATDTIFSAKINTNGTVGTWSTSTLPALRRIMSTVVLNGYMYVIGGQDGSIIRNTTYYAPLNNDGSIGTWNTTATLPDARAFTSASTYNGYIYVMGGFNTATSDDVYFAKVNANGTISSWGTTASMPTATRQPSSAAINGYLYVMGGRTSATTGSQIDTIQYAKLNPDGTISNWVSSAQALPQAKSEAMLVAVNGYIYTISGISTTNTSITTVHSMRMKTTLADTTNNTRYLWITATIDDTSVNGSYAETLFGQLQGLYIDYRIVAPPDSRLRGGKYFEGNTLQPLIRPESN